VDSTTLAAWRRRSRRPASLSTGITLDGTSVRARFDSTDVQLKAKDAIQKALMPDGSTDGYVVALNLLSRSPAWLSALHAAPMYLGLDLRGGVHFMLQVDMQAALTKKAEAFTGDIRFGLREKNVRHAASAATARPSRSASGCADAGCAPGLIADQFPICRWMWLKAPNTS
jgi:preprotein translocase subunit SecD